MFSMAWPAPYVSWSRILQGNCAVHVRILMFFVLGYGVPPEKPPRAEHVTHSSSNLSDLSSSHSGSSVKHRPDRGELLGKF